MGTDSAPSVPISDIPTLGGGRSDTRFIFVEIVNTPARGHLSWRIRAKNPANGMTLAINNGPNPKSNFNEMVLFYQDCRDENAPIISGYTYNGQNNANSFAQNGEEIFTSINDSNNIVEALGCSLGDDYTEFVFRTNNGNYLRNFKNTATYPDWIAYNFEELIGIWLHSFVLNSNTSYDANGFLENWKYSGGQAYVDRKDLSTS